MKLLFHFGLIINALCLPVGKRVLEAKKIAFIVLQNYTLRIQFVQFLIDNQGEVEQEGAYNSC
jgi:hypothetical protein